MSRIHARAGWTGPPLVLALGACTSSPTHPLDPPAIADAGRDTFLPTQRRWCAANIAELEHALARNWDAPAGG